MLLSSLLPLILLFIISSKYSPCTTPKLLTERINLKISDNCKYPFIHKQFPAKRSSGAKHIDVYWLNFNKDAGYILRYREHLRQVGLESYVTRVPSIDMADMVINNKVYSQWTSKSCVINSRSGQNAKISDVSNLKTTFNTLIELSPKPAAESTAKILVTGLCGRGKGRNSLKDLSVTLSHLVAIAEAIDSGKESSSDYALIVVDDTSFTLDINFDDLIASAPPGFAML